MYRKTPMTSSKKIVLFTTFSSADAAYSLNRVVQDQIKMFLHNGYEDIRVIVAEGFEPTEMYSEVKLVYVPNVPVYNEVKKDESFSEDVDMILDVLEKEIADVDVVLSHDVVYQPACLKHNFAARRFAQNHPNIRWLHWIHSATSPYTLQNLMGMFEDEYLDLVRKEFPNSFYIYFNHYSIPRIAHNFGVSEERVRIVHHPLDVCGFWGVHSKVAEFVDKKKLLDADAICVYPCRLDRGKQVEVAIKTMAMLKEFDMSVRMIVIDFHSTGGDKVVYRDELKATGIDWGLNSQELSFTSEFCPEWSAQVDQSIVRDFMLFQNVMIMPSVSESYSLVTQEAASLGCVTVLNKDFTPFRDIFGSHAIFRKYSAGIDIEGMDGWTNTEYGPSAASPEERKYYEKQYHKETAGMIASKLRTIDSFVLQRKILKERNLDAVFRKELEPLLYE